MIAVTYWAGWVRAHPVMLLVFGALAAAWVLFVAAYYRLTGEDGTPKAPRRGTRSRARGTRARRHAFLGSACRRAGTTRAWVTSWFWWCGTWHPWRAARERLALRARGITIGVTNVPGRDGKRPDPPPTRREAPVSTTRPDTHLHGGPGHPAGGLQAPAAGVSPPVNEIAARMDGAGLQGVPSPPPQETREPARLATGAERDSARLDYAPAAPFAGCLSDDTIARGLPAVQ